jgi:hypothetical protein
LQDAASATAKVVDLESGDNPPRAVKLSGNQIHLEPFAVAVVSW